MKSAVETVDPTRVKLSVEVQHDELAPSVDAAYKDIAKQISVPGFRKGKVPPRIIDQRVGRAAVMEQAVNSALPDFYRQAVTESGVRPLGQPSIEVSEVPELSGEGGQLAFVAEVDVRPQIELPDLASVTVTVSSSEVTDEDVEARLVGLRERFGTLTGVDRPAEHGDFVVLDLAAEIDGVEVDSVSGISYEIGSGNMLEGLDEALVELAAGESNTFETSLAGGEHAGEQAKVTVTATAVKRRELPEADDEFASLASEFDTMDELLDDLRSQAALGKRADQVGEARAELLRILVESSDFPVPAAVVDAEVDRHLEDEGRQDDVAHREEVREEATEALRSQLLFDAIGESLNVSVSQQELLEFLYQSAQQYGLDPQTFLTQAQQAGQLPAFVAELARTKAVALALREVKVVDGDGNEVDLTPLIGSAEQDAVESAAREAAAAAAAAEATAAGATR